MHYLIIWNNHCICEWEGNAIYLTMHHDADANVWTGNVENLLNNYHKKKTNLSNSHVTWQRYLALAGQEKRKVKKTKHTVEENKYSPSPSHEVLRVFQALYSTHLSSKPNALPGVFWSYHFPWSHLVEHTTIWQMFSTSSEGMEGGNPAQSL